MNYIIKYLRLIATTFCLTSYSLSFVSTAHADNFRVRIIRISSAPVTGDVIIQIKPGKNETDFTEKSRAMLVGSDLYTDRAMATLLTAISLNSEVIISVTNPPSFDDIQAITNIKLIVP